MAGRAYRFWVGFHLCYRANDQSERELAGLAGNDDVVGRPHLDEIAENGTARADADHLRKRAAQQITVQPGQCGEQASS